MFAPIALFVFNRPWHTEQTIAALARNVLADQSDLFIFCDGPRSGKDLAKVNEVRRNMKRVKGFKSVTVIESATNRGLANSIISGVGAVLAKSDTIIVLEDDMVTSKYFLSYMNQGLSVYANDNEVASINGYMFPVSASLPDTFFLKVADCWGWGTWKRAWQLFESNPAKLLNRILFKSLRKLFDFDNSYPYTNMLIRQFLGLTDSWAIRWYASTFVNNKLSLYPKTSLINNIGFDNSGTHTRSWSQESSQTTLQTEEVEVVRRPIQEDKRARNALAGYFRSSRIPVSKKVLAKLKELRLNLTVL